jgi:hypothetical protein
LDVGKQHQTELALSDPLEKLFYIEGKPTLNIDLDYLMIRTPKA